jgi:xylan 1,4-beta-xylosidase
MRTIAADVARPKGERRATFRRCVGSGHACLGLRAEWREHLALARRECGFEYVRFHGLLHDDMGVYAEDAEGDPVFGWQYVDSLYDYILGLGMKPFLELGFMPRALASGERTIFYWKGNVTPPRSYEKWASLVRELVRHLTLRYGRDEVTAWYFEVWNEPNLGAFWSSDMTEYFRLYEAAARAVKDVSPDYRVGGPATAASVWVPELIEFCERGDVPLDFIATHAYGAKGELDETGDKALRLVADPGAIVDDVRRVRREIESSARADLELHYTEWNSSYSPLDPVHDSYVNAAYILSKLKRTESLADSMSYWTFSDVFEEAGPPGRPFHGGFGLVNLQGLRKPAFFAYSFLNRLGPVELECDGPDAWITKSDRGVQALFWDFTQPDPGEPNKVYYRRDLPAKPAGRVDLSISGLAPGAYDLAVFRVGYRSNDVYTEYLDMGAPASLSREQVEELASRNGGAPSEVGLVTVDGSGAFKREFELSENDIFLVTLTRSG